MGSVVVVSICMVINDCCLRNALLWVTLLRSFWHRTLAGCSLPSGTSRMVSSILAILVPSHGIFLLLRYTAIYRDLGDTGIVT